MDPIALAAATALLGAMATDGWQQTRTAITTWWHKNHPQRAKDLSQELDNTYARAMEARHGGDEDLRRSLTDEWRQRFQQLIDINPNARQELSQLLDDHLTPTLSPAEQTQVRQIILYAQDQARQYVSMRDMHITGK